MNKLDYLHETSRGQLSLYFERWRKRFSIEIPMEPKSKNSISPDEKVFFQEHLDKKLTDSNRRGFLGPIAIELNFHPTENAPPHIHKLPKNYLDLLSQPTQNSKINRKNLLFRDDRQVQILIVNYHIEKRNEKPGISINAINMSNLMEDLNLIDKIKTNSFRYDDEKNSYDFEKLIDEDGNKLSLHSNLDDSIENYYLTIEMETFYDKHLEKKSYEKMLELDLYSIQTYLFALDKIRPNDIFYFYPKLIEDRCKVIKEDRIKNMLELNRNLIVSPTFSILDILALPTKKGETKKFKHKIRQSLIKFKNKYKFVSPLLINVSLTILYIPPKYQEIDLDNLARYIVPYVNEELQPSSKTFYTQEDIKGFTHSSITQYQVIRIPRLETDPEDGIVRFVLNKKDHYSSILQDVDTIISRWSEVID